MTLVRNRPLLLIPAFGLLLVAGLWSAVLYQLAREERSELATEMRATEALAALFEEHTLGSIRDADRTLLVIKYQIEHSGSVDLDQHLILANLRFRHLAGPQASLASISIDDEGLHHAPPVSFLFSGLNMMLIIITRKACRRHRCR